MGAGQSSRGTEKKAERPLSLTLHCLLCDALVAVKGLEDLSKLGPALHLELQGRAAIGQLNLDRNLLVRGLDVRGFSHL